MGEASFKGLTKKQVGLMVAVLTMYFFAPTQAIISSVLSDIGATYPEVSDSALTYLITLNNIAAVPAAFLFGILAGRFISFKTLSIIALLCFIVGGGLPVFLAQDAPFWILMSSRAIIGLGRGCFIPIVQTVLCGMFTQEKTRSAWFGIGSVFFNLGATFGTALAGVLAIFDWRFCFAFYLFAVIPLALFGFFFSDDEVKGLVEARGTGLVKFPAECWAYFVLYALAIVMSQTLWNYASTTMSRVDVDSVNVGFALSCFTIAASVAGLAFPFIYRFCRNFIIALGVGIMTIGFILLYSASQGIGSYLALFYAASSVIGFGCGVVTVGCPLSMSMTVAPAAVTAALSFNEVFHNSGSFIASPYSQMVFALTGTEAQTNIIFLVTFFFGVILTAISIVVGCRLRKVSGDRKRPEERGFQTNV